MSITTNYIDAALEKLKEERVKFKGNKYAEVMRDATYDVLVDFCKQDYEFAQAIVQSDKSFSDCMSAVATGISGKGISDITAFKKAVNFYFPGAEIKCTMKIDLIGSAAKSDEPTPQTPIIMTQKKSALSMSFDDLF